MVRCKCWVKITCYVPESSGVYKIIRKLESSGFKVLYFPEENRLSCTGECERLPEAESFIDCSTITGIVEGKCWGKFKAARKTFFIDDDRKVGIAIEALEERVKIKAFDANKLSRNTLELILKGFPITLPGSIFVFEGDKIWNAVKSVLEFLENKVTNICTPEEK